MRIVVDLIRINELHGTQGSYEVEDRIMADRCT